VSALDAAELGSRLKTERLGRSLEVLDEVGSTSDVVVRRAAEGAPHGHVVLAERQTKGRGRLGRGWVAPPGKNLSLSVLLRPALPPDRGPELTLAAAVAVAEALLELGCPARIKWPNDVQMDGRKCAGLLTEMSVTSDGGRIERVVLGIGVNLNARLEDLPPELHDLATSAFLALGREVDRIGFCAALLARLERWLELLETDSFSPVRARWTELSSTIGARVQAQLPGRVLEGVARGSPEGGALLVETAVGRLETVLAGDVHHVR